MGRRVKSSREKARGGVGGARRRRRRRGAPLPPETMDHVVVVDIEVAGVRRSFGADGRAVFVARAATYLDVKSE